MVEEQAEGPVPPQTPLEWWTVVGSAVLVVAVVTGVILAFKPYPLGHRSSILVMGRLADQIQQNTKPAQPEGFVWPRSPSDLSEPAEAGADFEFLGEHQEKGKRYGRYRVVYDGETRTIMVSQPGGQR